MKNLNKTLEDILGSRYRLDKEIASTGMSVVYAATRVKLGRSVAIKFLHPNLIHEREFLTRFELEAKATSQISHPNCVSVIDFGITSPPYLVMEFVPGQTLARIMKDGPMETARALLIIRQILSGLSHAHKQGIIHRDIKPKNIMITKTDFCGDFVRILDFGLAKYFREEEDNLTGKGRVAGTFEYFAPENIGLHGLERNLDQRTDLFSVGVLAYELLTGSKPFVAKSPSEIFHMHDTPPAPLTEVFPQGDYSPELESIVAKAVSKDPDQRYQDAEEFVAAVDSVLEMKKVWKLLPAPSPAAVPATATIQTARKETVRPMPPALPETIADKHRQPAWVSALLILVVAALDLWGWIEISDPQQDVPPAQTSLATVSVDSPIHIGSSLAPVTDPSDSDLNHAPETPRQMKAASGALTSIQAASKDTGERSKKHDIRAKRIEKRSAKHKRHQLSKKPRVSKRKCSRRRIAIVHRLVRRGKTRTAIKRLERLAEKYPSDGYLQLLLGNLYSKKRRTGEALAAYERALDLRKRYRRNKRLIENTVRALAYRKSHAHATAIIENKIGKPARRYLRKARHNAYGKMARKRSVEILRRWSQKNRKPDHVTRTQTRTVLSRHSNTSVRRQSPAV